jgi:hypothetical protein
MAFVPPVLCAVIDLMDVIIVSDIIKTETT